MPDWNWLQESLDELDRGGLRRRRRCVTPLADGWCEVDGRRLRNLAGNDYLGLAHHPAMIAAAQQALQAAGTGITASALVTGRSPWHVDLEQAAARFWEQREAILFPSGFAANQGTIAALAGPEDVIFCDRANHACLVDGCRLSGARFRVYRHADLASLERWLEKSLDARRRWIVTDGVFSMEGDLAPLADLCELAERFEALVLVDEAHAVGVLGTHGRGAVEQCGVEAGPVVRVGTFSKSLAAQGGFVAGSPELVDYLWHRARPQMYSTALPPSVCAAARAGLDLVTAEPQRRERVLQLGQQLRDALTSQGIATLPGMGPIVPVLVGDPHRVQEWARQLELRGFLVGAIRSPTVPAGTDRLRITISANVTADVIAELVQQLVEIRDGSH